MLGDDTKGFYEIIALHIIYNILQYIYISYIRE